MEYFVRFTVKSSEVDVLDILRFIRHIWSGAKHFNTEQLTYVAQCIKNGEGWEPDFDTLHRDIAHQLKAGIFSSQILSAKVTSTLTGFYYVHELNFIFMHQFTF